MEINTQELLQVFT